MHPVLFKIPFIDLSIHMYGVLVALAFLAGMFWINREAKIKGLNQSAISDLLFYVILVGVLASRATYVLVSERDAFFANPLMFFQIWKGGLVFYGGFIPAMIFSIWFSRKKGLSFVKVADCFAPALAIGHAIGRIGCFMAGCCHGRVVDASKWYTVIFPSNPDCLAPQNVPVYPTQLFESFGELMIFAILLLFRRRQKFNGEIIAIYIIAYAILRAFNEYFRGDSVRGFVIDPWLSTSQFVSILMLIAGGLIIYFKRNDSVK